MFKHIFVAEVLCLALLTSGISGQIECSTGQMNSSTYIISYNISKIPVLGQDGCYAKYENAETEWPGAPRDFRVVKSTNMDKTALFSWKPPDDGSATFLRGFSLQLYVTTYSSSLSFRPTACYLIELSPMVTRRNMSEDGPVIQDAGFSLQCQSQYSGSVTVTLFLASVPISQSRSPQEIKYSFNLSANIVPTHPSSRGTKSQTVTSSNLTTPPASSLCDDTCRTLTIVLVCTVIVAVLIGTVVIFVRRRRTASRTITTSNDSTIELFPAE